MLMKWVKGADLIKWLRTRFWVLRKSKPIVNLPNKVLYFFFTIKGGTEGTKEKKRKTEDIENRFSAVMAETIETIE